ncbi:MAG: helicase-related protein, partial [Cyclobacteriaceae bacterium]
KRMAEEMDKYLHRIDIRSKFIHSDVDTLERVEILRALRLGKIDVLVGVNLLREGLDIPEVSLVAILDADKEGFLRNEKSLTQTAGRAARNVNGLVIFYADKITDSMQRTIDETTRRRQKQMDYNQVHGITPTTIQKSTQEVFSQTSVLYILDAGGDANAMAAHTMKQLTAVLDEQVEYTSKSELEKAIKKVRKEMDKAAQRQDYMEAASLRDEVFRLEARLKEL